MFWRTRKTAEADFIESALSKQSSVIKPITPHHYDNVNSSFGDSSFDLQEGSDVTEFDTVPSELLDLFK